MSSLEQCDEPNLALSAVPALSGSHVSVFTQGNVTASRKKVLPLLKSSLAGLQSPDSGAGEDPSSDESSGHDLLKDFDLVTSPDSAIAGTGLELTTTSDLSDDSDPLSSSFIKVEKVDENPANPDADEGSKSLGYDSGEKLVPVDVVRSSRSSTVDSLDPFYGHVDVLMELTPGTTPELQSTPPVISTPDDSYPATPPSSYVEPSLGPNRHQLPSFNSSEMVQRIQAKKATLSHIEEDEDDLNQAYPFTPQNSFAEFGFTTEPNLPTFNKEVLDKVRSKRAEFGGPESDAFDDGEKERMFVPPNSYAESPLVDFDPSAHELIAEDLERRMLAVERRDTVSSVASQGTEAAVPDTDKESNPTVAAGDLETPPVDQDMHERASQAKMASVASRPAALEQGSSPGPLIYRGNSEVEVAYHLAQDIIQRAIVLARTPEEREKLVTGAQRISAEGEEPVVYRGNSDVEVAYQVAQDIIHRASAIAQQQEASKVGEDKAEAVPKEPHSSSSGSGYVIMRGKDEHEVADAIVQDVIDRAKVYVEASHPVDEGKLEELVKQESTETEVAYRLAQDIIQRALDTFENCPDVEHPSEPGRSPRRSLARSYSIEECPVETDYLSQVDPLRGSISLVSSPLPDKAEVAESQSFNLQVKEDEVRRKSISDMQAAAAAAAEAAASNRSSIASDRTSQISLPDDVARVLAWRDRGSTHQSSFGGDSTHHGSSFASMNSDGGGGGGDDVMEFLRRLRSQSGASTTALSGEEDALFEMAQQMDLAKKIVDDAIKSAVRIYRMVSPFYHYILVSFSHFWLSY